MGPLSEMKPEEHCSLNFVSVKNKEIYVDKPVEEFSGRQLPSKRGAELYIEESETERQIEV